MRTAAPTQYSTVSSQFIEYWLVALRSLGRYDPYVSLLRRTEFPTGVEAQQGRVTLNQIVCLCLLAAVETGDEMMGL